MNNKQAIKYIESLMSRYEASRIWDKFNSNYRYVGMWMSDRDMIALKMGIEALKEKEVQPVIHAQWLGTEYDGYSNGFPVYSVWKCSNCGAEFECEDMDFHYCPNCGAKMDKENKDGKFRVNTRTKFKKTYS